MRRSRTSRRHDKRKFTKTSRPKSKNIPRPNMRGGIRL